MITPSKTIRRPLKFKTTEEMNIELDHLQKANYKKLGKWSLPQACRHLAMTIEGSLDPAPNDIPTPEEAAMKAKFFGMVMNPQGMPENLPIGNPALIPSEDCSEGEIDRLKASFEKLATLPHKQIKVGRCGPVPVSEVVEIHLAHAAHHISFLVPLVPSPMRKKSAEYRTLSFADIPAALAEIDRLQKGPYRQLGNWNLPTIAWHVVTTLGPPFKPATDPNPTPQQAQMQAGFLDVIIQTGKPPAGASPPIEVMPMSNCTDADVEKLKNTLQDLAAYPHPQAEMGPFGPVPIEKFRKVHLVHLSHHLGFLVPQTQRRELHFTDIDEVIADINHLRRGCTKMGSWNLQQICWHLGRVTHNTATPATPATPEQAQLRPLFEQILASGRIPSGIVAPDPAIPPADCTDADIDSCIATFNRVRKYDQPTAMHRRFGPITAVEFQKLILIHSAHHLSHLIPTTDN